MYIFCWRFLSLYYILVICSFCLRYFFVFHLRILLCYRCEGIVGVCLCAVPEWYDDDDVRDDSGTPTVHSWLYVDYCMMIMMTMKMVGLASKTPLTNDTVDDEVSMSRSRATFDPVGNY